MYPTVLALRICMCMLFTFDFFFSCLSSRFVFFSPILGRGCIFFMWKYVVPALLARVCPFWHVGADRARTAPVGDYRTCSCCCAHACMLIVRILVVFGAFFLRLSLE